MMEPLTYIHAVRVVTAAWGRPHSVTATPAGRIARWGGLTVEDDAQPGALITTESTGNAARLTEPELRELLEAIA